MQGSVDIITPEHTLGWLFGPHAAKKPLVQAVLHHRVIGQAVAEMYRPDLEQVGFGDGCCGFEIQFTETISPAQLPFVEIRPDGSNLTIPTTTNGAFRDLVLAVAREFPAAGRTRSVLGGLWTDRADAPLVLAGRMAVGSCLPELQTALQAFIANGHVTLNGAMAPSGLTEKELALLALVQRPEARAVPVPAEIRGALTAICSFLFRDTVVKVLRAVFDDHPVAYRLDFLQEGDPAFFQACVFELFPSPAECVVAYIGGKAGGVRIETLRDSHELPEFGPSGQSRWTPAGGEDLLELAKAAGASVDVIPLDATDMVLVGPGLVHRVVLDADASVLRAVLAPRRITPERFLTGDAAWIEAGHVSGARVRI